MQLIISGIVMLLFYVFYIAALRFTHLSYFVACMFFNSCILYLLCTWVFPLHVSAPHVCSAQEGQKRASNLFGTVVTRELNLGPLQSNKCSLSWSYLCSHPFHFYLPLVKGNTNSIKNLSPWEQ